MCTELASSKRIREALEDLRRLFSEAAPEYLTKLFNDFGVDKAVSIGFTLPSDPRVNAFAEGRNGTYAICLHSGVVDSVFETIMFLTDTEDTATILGLESPLGSKGYDEQRAELAACVVDSAMRFVLIHEFCHIILGHLDWLHSKHDLSRLSENGDNRGLDFTTFHALELHADSIALGPLMTQRAVDTHYIGIAAAVLYNLLAAGIGDIHTHDGKTHPHPFIRSSNLYALVDSTMQNDPNAEQMSRWLKGAADALACLRRAGRDVLLTPTVEHAGEENMPTEVSIEVKRVHERILELMQELEPLHGLETNA